MREISLDDPTGTSFERYAIQCENDLLDRQMQEQNIHEQRIDHKPIRLTIRQSCEGDPEFMEEGIYEVVLLSEFDNRICCLSDGCTFEGAHDELTTHIGFFKERGCDVEVVA